MAAVAGIPILFMFFSSAKDKARRPTVPSAGLGAPAAANIPARKSWWDPALRQDLTSSHFIRLVAATLIIRSEEHTYELQSLMRISYAVFCLKKKTHTKTHRYTTI